MKASQREWKRERWSEKTQESAIVLPGLIFLQVHWFGRLRLFWNHRTTDPVWHWWYRTLLPSPPGHRQTIAETPPGLCVNPFMPLSSGLTFSWTWGPRSCYSYRYTEKTILLYYQHSHLKQQSQSPGRAWTGDFVVFCCFPFSYIHTSTVLTFCDVMSDKQWYALIAFVFSAFAKEIAKQ